MWIELHFAKFESRSRIFGVGGNYNREFISKSFFSLRNNDGTSKCVDKVHSLSGKYSEIKNESKDTLSAVWDRKKNSSKLLRKEGNELRK